MKKTISICIMGIILVISGCSSPKDEDKADQSQVQEQQNKTKTESVKKDESSQALTKEAMEAKLKEIGISIYPGAVFQEIFFKYGGNTISYDVTPATQESKEKVDQYYKTILEDLPNHGWKKLLSIGEIPRYGKGDEEISFAHGFNEQASLNRIIISYSKKQ